MILSKRSHEGYLMVDHRASPGIPEDKALQMGLDPYLVKEGKVYETPTMTCSHCGVVVIMNPKRTRERAYCSKCDNYVCDTCDAARKETGYIHQSLNDLKDLVSSGNYKGRINNG